MATTTTIYADTDANLREDAPDTNYSGNSSIRCGQYGSSERRHGVLKFDVSSFTKPSDIITANLYLTISSDSGSTRTMKIARLNQDFVESEVTWNIASTGVAWTGGAGGEGNGAFTEPTYSISVGNLQGDQEVDIKDLVVDAINRRDNELWLIICFDPADTAQTPTGNSAFYPSEDATASNRPKIAVTVADRIAWVGTVDGDASNYRNYNPTVLPTTSDYVLFNDGSVSVTTGNINCHSLYIGEDYTGEIATTGGSAIRIVSSTSYSGQEAVINKSKGKFLLEDYEDYNRSIYIKNTPSDACTWSNTAGSYNMFVDKTVGNLSVVGDSNLVMSSSKNSKRVTTSGTKTDIIANGKKLTLDNGCNNITLANGGRVIGKDCVDGDLTIASGVFNQLGNAVNGDLVMYGGVFNFKNNENAVSDTVDVYLWRKAMFMAKSDSTDWSPQGVINIRGGNFVLDIGSSIDVS